jgi:hypothetical protein
MKLSVKMDTRIESGGEKKRELRIGGGLDKFVESQR